MYSNGLRHQRNQRTEKSHKSKNQKFHKQDMLKSSRIEIEGNQVCYSRTWWDHSLRSECCSRCKLQKKKNIKKKQKSQQCQRRYPTVTFGEQVEKKTKSNKVKSGEWGNKIRKKARVLSFGLLIRFICSCTFLGLIKINFDQMFICFLVHICS